MYCAYVTTLLGTATNGNNLVIFKLQAFCINILGSITYIICICVLGKQIKTTLYRYLQVNAELGQFSEKLQKLTFIYTMLNLIMLDNS